MPAVSLLIFGGVGAQFFDNNGNPLSGGKIYTYEAGTTTPKPTYTSSTGNTAHTNPIVLDAAGRVPGGEIWVIPSELYKLVLKTSAEVLIATYDNVSSNLGTIPTIANFTGDGSTVAFTLASTPVNENATNIYINGVYQQKNTYSIAGAVITFSQAPPVTSSIEVSYIDV
jgi:hypothetical protein